MMKRSMNLEKTIKSLDGQKYGAYKRMKGIYAFDQFHLAIDHVQVDHMRHLQNASYHST